MSNNVSEPIPPPEMAHTSGADTGANLNHPDASTEQTPRKHNKFTAVAMGGAKKVGHSGFTCFSDFKAFINRGNVIDLAIGLILGTAFTAVVTSLVNDIISPLIGLGTGANLSESFAVIGYRGNSSRIGHYATRADAQADSAITLNWGNFVQTLINFVLIALCVFGIVKVFMMILRKKLPGTKPCPACMKDIDETAIRCPDCTSWIDELGHIRDPMANAEAKNSGMVEEPYSPKESNSMDTFHEGVDAIRPAGKYR